LQIVRFDAGTGKAIDAYGSVGLAMSRIGGSDGPVHFGCMHLDAGGSVGRHQAPVRQLFLVVNGQGEARSGPWESASGDPWVPLKPGFAAVWEAGEWHEVRTANGLTAIVMEGDSVRSLMPSADVGAG